MRKAKAMENGGAAVTLVGGGPVEREDLEEAVAIAPCIVAADGGARHVLEAGLMPERVIGDMDSLDDATRAGIDATRLCHVDEQDSTDFEKCLSRIKAPLVIGLGFMGGRADHTLAAMSVLARLGGPHLLIGAEDLCFAAGPGATVVDLAPGTRVSLFPLASVTGRSQGLEWPIDGIDFAPDGRIGTSNRATGAVRLDLNGRGMLVILPRACLAEALAAVGAGPFAMAPRT
ncbi:thiamine diphosphokinase [Palleronia sp. LCG004]|uniref:thiamine diphosphokinase n=1 Tax=Palleronia sp. LCG004 TaxID=3079304 RepID=UPI002942D7DF|nr:thiamine diphosphokinase [Palleronia sp. LCG004]WOI55659.1 thiamine diphosphokinase [Palleronia sp. LCG004]